MRRCRLTALGAAICLFAAPAAEAPTISSTAAPPTTVVKRTREYPDRHKRRAVRVVPDARPGRRRAQQIARWEAVRWGVPYGRIARRIHCESRWKWYASNGPYEGLGQFHPSTFWRGVGSMPRRVRVKHSRLVWRHTVRVVYYADGSIKRSRGYKVRVRRTRILRGTIRPTSVTHGWAQLRIVAQAIAGRSAVRSGEWACPA